MVVALRLVILFLLLSIPTLAQQRSQGRPPIIDVHFHAHRADRFGKVGIPNPVTGKPSAATTEEALLRAALAAMRRYNIVKAFASSRLDSVGRWRSASPGLLATIPKLPARRSYKKISAQNNSAYEAFARQWQRYLYPGQLAIMRTLFKSDSR